MTRTRTVLGGVLNRGKLKIVLARLLDRLLERNRLSGVIALATWPVMCSEQTAELCVEFNCPAVL